MLFHPSRAASAASPRPAAGRPTPGLRGHLGLFWIPLLVGALLVAFVGFTEFEWRDVPSAFTELNLALLLTAMALLPIAGFPISVVYLAAGLRFGPLWGGVVVAGVTAIHPMGSRWVARRFLRGPVERFLSRRGYHLPDVPAGAGAGLTAMGVLVPGPPYFARNYLLALADIPLVPLLAAGVPLYVARAYVVIFLGDLTHEPSTRGFVILGAIYALKLGVCAAVLWRMRRHYLRRRAAAPGKS